MTKPCVSVVMAVYRPDPRYFPEAVRSVLDQAYDDCELVIIEDPSEVDGRDLLVGVPHERIRHIVNPVRTSLVQSRNQGLNEARGDLVALLDADDVCRPDRIERQVAFLARHDEVCVLGAQMEIIDAEGACLGWRRYPLEHEAIVRAMARFNPLAQSTVMLRRQRVIDLGEYHYVDVVTEDYELWSRLARTGARFANLPEALVRYRVHPDARKVSTLRKTIRGTLDVKRTYWRNRMNAGDRLRVWLEHLLLLLPPSLVYRLFVATQFTRRAGDGR